MFVERRTRKARMADIAVPPTPSDSQTVRPRVRRLVVFTGKLT
jgi:hypothetical protein